MELSHTLIIGSILQTMTRHWIDVLFALFNGLHSILKLYTHKYAHKCINSTYASSSTLRGYPAYGQWGCGLEVDESPCAIQTIRILHFSHPQKCHMSSRRKPLQTNQSYSGGANATYPILSYRILLPILRPTVAVTKKNRQQKV